MKKPEIIKCIFFDLGGVIVDIYIDRCLKAFSEKSELTLPEIKDMLSQNNKVIIDFNLGKMTPKQFYAISKNQLKLNMDYQDFVQAYTNIFEIKKFIFELIPILAKRTRLSIISNTDVLHYNAIKMNYEIMSYFQHPTASYEIGRLKPDTGIYKHALSMMQVNAPEALFIDDKEININAAAEMGLKTILYHDNIDLSKEIFKYQLYKN